MPVTHGGQSAQAAHMSESVASLERFLVCSASNRNAGTMMSARRDTMLVEYHLTPRYGWHTGGQAEGMSRSRVDRPTDCLLHIRVRDTLPTDNAAPAIAETDVLWMSPNTDKLNLAQDRWGALPEDAPPLSADAAQAHRNMRFLPDMLQPPKMRRRGRNMERKPFGTPPRRL